MWYQVDNGATIGTKGSENGEIQIDEEHSAGARLTLEKDGDIAPYAITSGIYGSFFHTTFLSNEEDAKIQLNLMKCEIIEYFETKTTYNEECEWIKQFINRH
ncbi:hypothetical protein LDC_2762 [sediment metagenome]|uniref:Uncharacterized protein n=1 Tax=sediment metagenome TaxID=749907 RepID=D9PMI4_9ZZZZ